MLDLAEADGFIDNLEAEAEADGGGGGGDTGAGVLAGTTPVTKALPVALTGASSQLSTAERRRQRLLDRRASGSADGSSGGGGGGSPSSPGPAKEQPVIFLGDLDTVASSANPASRRSRARRGGSSDSDSDDLIIRLPHGKAQLNMDKLDFADDDDDVWSSGDSEDRPLLGK